MPDLTLFALPHIIDNSTEERRLSSVLQKMLTQDSQLDIATAYFNVEGLALVREAVDALGNGGTRAGNGRVTSSSTPRNTNCTNR